ncbi:Ltp family lipoprotein [Limosilactobacillus mucosae]|uniref:Ltp family lipoprotein n=1 Tax=Limosilactobacillus mucosae TaxID=97478 RepID=UPI00233E9A63|nr:Ltp family lipoprotein [Limosilactobacillus mucosae]MDC2841920.1 Ltp family lipoprotein [Limosilactobacillus mucosae]
MAKQIKGEDGKVYVEKKPIYKRVWFWILVVLVIFIGSAAVSGGNDNSSSSSSSSSAKSSSSSSSHVSATKVAALKSAQTYSDTMHMSKQGIYDQLTSDAGDKFDDASAQYAVDHVKADWNKNALKAAESYQKDQNMSPEAIRDQLTSDAGDKFTQDQADYAVSHLPQ